MSIKVNEYLKLFESANPMPDTKETCKFGFVKYFRKLNLANNKLTVYPGIHWGSDRSSRATGKLYTHLDFKGSKYECFEDGKGYGTRCSFYHKEGFVWRIGHMYPEDIYIIQLLKDKMPISEDVLVGLMGDYGEGTGKHFHHEITSCNFISKTTRPYLPTCKLLDNILIEKYGEYNFYNELSDKYVIDIYRKCKATKNMTEYEILEDYKDLLKVKNIFFINEYRIVRRFGQYKSITQRTNYNPASFWD